MRRLTQLVFLPALALPASACGGAFDSQGPQAARIEDAFWLMFWLALVIFLVVMALLAYALFHRRTAPHPSSTRDKALVGIGGFALPLVVLALLMGVTVDALGDITGPPPDGALHIQVTGADWWWDVQYPDQGVRTANIIHIPVGETVAITGLSRDVIHSFWVPQLAGKMDLIPGKPNDFKLRADQPGTYRGQCAEYCGISHAKMAFYVVAEPRDQFDAWIRQQQQPANMALDARADQGRQIFFSSSCVACHGIKGTEANAPVGPDLTHLASRNVFAGATEELTSDNLAEWIDHPRGVKPGALMPATELTPDEMSALVSFLLSLK